MKNINSKLKYACIIIAALISASCSKNIVSSIIPTEERKIKNIVQEQGNAVVFIGVYSKKGNLTKYGSGFFVSKDGLIATNYHVIENGYGAVIKSLDGKVLKDVYLISFDKDKDIALLKVDETTAFYARLGNSDSISQGDKIVTIGNPEGLQNTISDGIVSGIREIEGMKLFQITCPISGGSSGGPLYNLDGDVIGITTLVSKIGQNLNFAVPINYLKLIQKDEKKISIKEKTLAEEKILYEKYFARQLKSSEFDEKDSLFEDAYNLYTEAIKKGFPLKAPAASDDKVSLEKKPDTSGAIDMLEKAIEINPYYHAAYVSLGVLYERNGNYSEAEKSYLKSIDLKPKYQIGYTVLARLYENMKRIEDAVVYYRKALSIGPADSSIYESLGDIFFDSGNKAEAENNYKKVIELKGASFNADGKLVTIYLDKGDIKSSWEHLNKTFPLTKEEDLANQINPYKQYIKKNNYYAYMSVGYIYYWSDKSKEAIKYLEKAYELNANEFDKFYELASSHYTEDNYQKAISYYEKVLLKNPQHHGANLQLGSIYDIEPDMVTYYEKQYGIKPNYERSIELLKKIKDSHPKDSNIRYQLGRTYYNIGQYYNAFQETSKSVEIKPDYRSLLQLGNIYSALKDNRNAVTYYEKAYELSTKPFDIYTIGNKFIELKENDKAINVLIKGISKYKNTIDNNSFIAIYHSMLGNIYLQKEQYQTAIQHYEESIIYSPKNYDASFGIASCYFRLKNYDQAEKWWKKASSINPKSETALYNIGLVNLNKVKYEAAIVYFKKALEVNPSYEVASKMIDYCSNEIDKNNYPNKLRELADREDNIGIIANLLLCIEEYNQANNLWIQGTKDTRAVYGGYSKEYITEYQVSSNIYESQGRYEKIKRDLNEFKRIKGKLKIALNFLSTAVEQRIEGIQEHAKGYYTLKKDYKGEFERGTAKIKLANVSFAEGLNIINKEVIKYKSLFGKITVENLNDYIEYYSKK